MSHIFYRRLPTAKNTDHPIHKLGEIFNTGNKPDLDGFSVLKKLANDSSSSHIPVIALSAHATKIDIEKGLDAGFQAYLIRPANINELIKTVDSLLHA